MTKKVKMGMVGGGGEGFIGAVHRMAAAIDGEIDLVAGAFSSNYKKSLETGKSLGLDLNRVYDSYETMLKNEVDLPSDEKIDFISIVTPNNLHFGPAIAALKAGFHVLCEKPLTFNTEEAERLESEVYRTNLLFGVTYTYTGYPLVKEARALIENGKIGNIRKIVTEYPQGWLSSGIENSGQKQALWRTDPTKAGKSGCVADIGTHAQNLTEYISGLKIVELSADISTFVKGRLLEDDANILVRFDSGAKGVILVSQIAAGDENELKIRIYGETGSIEWLQSSPNALYLKNYDGSVHIMKAGSGNKYLCEHALINTRVPGGHPEGYLEAMANIYRNFALAVTSKINGLAYPDFKYDFPSISDGVRSMKFIDAVIESGKNNGIWTRI